MSKYKIFQKKTYEAGRNFGHGNDSEHATKNLFKNNSVNGASGSAVHYQRIKKYVRFLKTEFHITKLEKVTIEHNYFYAEYVQYLFELNVISQKYAINLISSVNSLWKSLNKYDEYFIAPSDFFGRKQVIRQVKPNLSVNAVNKASLLLHKNNEKAASVMLLLCRHFGLRFKESLMINCHDALREYKNTGKCNIVRGTKGGRGRSVERWVPVNNCAFQALKEGAELQSARGSFIKENQSYIEAYRKLHRKMRSVVKQFKLNKIHDLRAAYVCQRYEELTGYPAPICRIKGEEINHASSAVLLTISLEIGHSRESIIYSYSGK